MLFYILYHDPSLDAVGPFSSRDAAIEWALARERRRERSTMWIIIKSEYPHKRFTVTIQDPFKVETNEK